MPEAKPNLQRPLLAIAVSSLIAVACALAYSNTFGVPFLFDDLQRIRDEVSIRTLWPPTVAMHKSNRPFAQYTFAINYALHGYDVFGYHAVNLCIHCLAALCLFGLVKRTMFKCSPVLSNSAHWIAFSIALIWAVHPLNTQSVTYIVQRLESLMGLSYLATLYFFVRAQDSKAVTFWLSCSLCACFFGMGCKEVMVTAPMVVMWFDRAFIAADWKELFEKRKYYYVLLFSSWSVLAWSMLHYQMDYRGGALIQVAGLTPWTYLLSQSSVLVHYLSLAFWPSGQCIYPDWPVAHSIGEVWPQFVLIGFLLAGTIWSIFRHRKWSFFGGSFFLILAPTSSILPIKDLAFEHRMYLPLASVVALVQILLFVVLDRFTSLQQPRSKKFHWLHGLVTVLLALALGMTTFERNKVFQNEISLWKDTVAKSPRNLTVLTGLACIYAKERNFDEANLYFARALEIAPNDPKANANYAGLLIEQKEFELAGQHLERAFQSDPNDLDAITNMAHLQNRLGNFHEAVMYYEVAVKGAANDEDLQSSFVASQICSGKLSDALLNSQANLRSRPNSAKANVDYASALIGIGRVSEAIAYCEKAIGIDERLANAHGTLATLETDSGKAIARMTRAIELEPSSFDFHRAMGDMLIATKPEEAVKHFEMALKADADNVEVLLKIGVAWDASGHPERGLLYLERVTQLLPDWAEARESLDLLRKTLGHQN